MTNNTTKGKDWLDRLDILANVLGTIGTLGIAVIGFWFTSSYNIQQQNLEKNEALTSVIEYIDGNKPEEQLKIAYNILINLGYEQEFMGLAVDYPNSISTQKLLYLLSDDIEDNGLKMKFSESLESILKKAEKLDSSQDILTKKQREKLITSVEIIAKQQINQDLSEKVEDILGKIMDKENSETKTEKSWVVIFGSYRSQNVPQADINMLKTAVKDTSSTAFKVYERDQRYRLVAVYPDEIKAQEALKKAKQKRQSSYVRNLENWCEKNKCTEIK
jgi:hypothetical protein